MKSAVPPLQVRCRSASRAWRRSGTSCETACPTWRPNGDRAGAARHGVGRATGPTLPGQRPRLRTWARSDSSRARSRARSGCAGMSGERPTAGPPPAITCSMRASLADACQAGSRRSRGGGDRPAAAGPRPSPSEPWQAAQRAAKSSAAASLAAGRGAAGAAGAGAVDSRVGGGAGGASSPPQPPSAPNTRAAPASAVHRHRPSPSSMRSLPAERAASRMLHARAARDSRPPRPARSLTPRGRCLACAA